MEQSNIPIIMFDNVSHIYISSDTNQSTMALSAITTQINQGEFVFVVGKSGSGKSTFIKLLLKEITPTSGRIFVAGQNVAQLDRKEVSKHRRQLGIVFQDFRLIKNKTVFENIALAQEIIGVSRRQIKHNVLEVMDRVGILGKEKFYPNELSGGEQQRVAIARALINKPSILLADEPTGNLDPQTAWEIMMLLKEINDENTTVVVVTHNNDIVDMMRKRVITLDDGKIIYDEQRGGYQYAKA